MGYNRNTPGNGAFISKSQRKMRSNSFTIDDVFARDHYALSDEDDFKGKHRKLTLPNQSAPTTLSDEIALYSRDDGGDQVVTVREPSSGSIYNILDIGANEFLKYGELRIGAYLQFDKNANMLQSINISSISDNTTNFEGTIIGDFTLNFTSSLPSNDYFIDIQYFNSRRVLPRAMFILPDATYGNSVADSFIKLGVNFEATATMIFNVFIWYLP